MSATYGPALIPLRAKNTAVPTPGTKLRGSVIKYLTKPSALNLLTGFNNSFPKVTAPFLPEDLLIFLPWETSSV